MRRTLFLTALALLATPLAAQWATPAQAQVVISAQPDACPVGFNAQLSTGPGMVIVDSGTRSPVSQQMLLSFRNPATHDITSMRVTVHGLTAKGQTLPVVTDSANAPGTIDTPATIHLSVAPNSGNSTQLRVRGITSVRSIDLDEVIYADGSSWHTTANHGCRIEPNRVMLIASH